MEKTYTIKEIRTSKRNAACGHVTEVILHSGTFAELAKELHVETSEDLHIDHDLPWSTRAPKTVRGIVSILNRATAHADILANKGGYDIQAWSAWILE
jgi:hypothetical protein